MFQVVPEAGLVEVSHLEPRVSEEFQAVAIGVIKRMAQSPSDSARNPGLTSDTRVSTFPKALFQRPLFLHPPMLLPAARHHFVQGQQTEPSR